MWSTEPQPAKALLVDTGPLYALSVPSDQHHQRARQEMAHIARDAVELIVPHPILMETYGLLLRRVHLTAAHEWLTQIAERTAQIAPSVDDYEEALQVPRRYPDQRLSLFDTQLAVLGKRFGLPVWTYDAHFDVLGVPVWRPA